jgi:hypothetical protein
MSEIFFYKTFTNTTLCEELAFAYNTVLPYGRVGKPRGIYLMKELVNGLNEKP